MNTRIVELDFVKGVLITLMVLCHLSLFVMTYKSAVSWVYCFHMSGFLFISGYLQNVKENKLRGGGKKGYKKDTFTLSDFRGYLCCSDSLIRFFLGK